jgi:hypothetical protein
VFRFVVIAFVFMLICLVVAAVAVFVISVFLNNMSFFLIFKYHWVQVVQRVLRAHGLPEPPELFTRTVRDTVKLVSLYQGFPISKARDQVLHDMFCFTETFCFRSFSNHISVALPELVHD